MCNSAHMGIPPRACASLPEPARATSAFRIAVSGSAGREIGSAYWPVKFLCAAPRVSDFDRTRKFPQAQAP
jgi:hypothetical protein